MVNAIAEEIGLKKEYISEEVKTIYFGGGTPSLLSNAQLKKLLDAVYENFEVSKSAEITLEANPEDLSLEHAKSIRENGVNRLSIGMQTFDESRLKWMNRIHSSGEAIRAFENARAAGFENISLDLIYALPDLNEEDWKADLQRIVPLNPEHISLYGLTIEEKTVFGKWKEQNKLIEVPDDDAAQQYLFGIEFLKSKNYKQYEVSNFGKEGFYSRHNNAYWSGTSYLGVGPGAHSFDGENTRTFNVRNNAKYLKAIENNQECSEVETLSGIQRINERILTELRTAKGVDLTRIESLTGSRLENLHSSFLNEMASKNMIDIQDGFLRLKPHGFLVADEIALRLFFSE